LTELGTSIHRHWANTFTDYRKQNIYNLFLGIYQPLKNKTALWNINDDRELLLSMEQAPSELKGLPPKWWERHLKGFEAGLAPKLVKDLQPIFRKKDIEAETTGDSSPETKQTVALECNQSK
jgi:hypothetical protein